MPNTPEVVRRVFPGAVEMTTYLTDQEEHLAAEGFRPGDALGVAACCRDEIVSEFRAEIRRRWNWAFDFSSLSGLPLAGVTGIRAVIDHAPHTAGNPRIVIFAMPHIGILEDGRLGRVHRRGRSRSTTACGSLIAACDWVRNNPPAGTTGAAGVEGAVLDDRLRVDRNDPEQSLVRHILRHRLGAFDRLPPARLIDAVADIMVDEMWSLVDQVTVPTEDDVALISGILVHGPDGDYVQPRVVRVRTDGHTTEHR